MKGYGRIALALTGLVAVSGCFSSGRNFPSDIDWVEKNTTKQSDVEMLLGAPTAVGNSGGTPTWTYGYYEYSLFGDASFKELKLYWNSNKTVENYTFTSSFATDRAGSSQGSKAKK